MSKIRSHEKIIEDAGSYKEIADRIGAPKTAVRDWRLGDRIPAWWWLDFEEAGFASLRELAEYCRETASQRRPANL